MGAGSRQLPAGARGPATFPPGLAPSPTAFADTRKHTALSAGGAAARNSVSRPPAASWTASEYPTGAAVAERPVYNVAMMRVRARFLQPIVAVLSVVLSACSPEVTAATVVPFDLAIPAAPIAVLPTPTALPGPLAPAPTDPCTNDAQYLEDLTLPDGTEVIPGAALDKRWLILNRGSCAWGPEYRLVQIGESRIEGPRELALYPAVEGSQAVWQVAMTAPLEKGEYISRWQARAPDGTLFGDEVYVLIVVNPAPLTPTAIPTAPRP